MRKQDLFLEEAVLDDLASGMNALEVPVSSRVFQILFLSVLAVGLIVMGRMLDLGWLNRDLYTARAFSNANAITILPAERGIILDRYGKVLAKNEPSFDLTINFSKFLKAYPHPAEPLRELENITGVESGAFEARLQDTDPLRGDGIVLFPRLTIQQVLRVKELGLEGVNIEDAFNRSYENGEAFAHVLGYVGAATREDLRDNPALEARDLIGKTGLEAQYDRELRGSHGETIDHRDARGNLLGNQTAKSPQAGNFLETTLDKDLQIFFYERLKKQLAVAGNSGGVGIAINPQNGEVLSLVSLPSFDNHKIDLAALRDPDRPLFNRSISGLYAPGSTIKPLVATAALAEGIFQTTDKVFSRGYIEVPNPYNPESPSRFVDWKPHGWVDVHSALARSSNIFFYAAGGGLPGNERSLFEGSNFPRGLGIDRLHSYWQEFGLGDVTGIDIPGEAKGFLPSIEAKEEKGGTWRLGDTYNVSIGQGDLLITPMELVWYIGAIANGGKFYEPHLLKKITDHDGEIRATKDPKLVKDISGKLGPWIAEVQKGMRDGVAKSYGTSVMLNDLGWAAAGKTGSAQIQNNQKVNALFTGYAPADGLGVPEIAILVLIEEAREGSLNAVPVAHDVLRWYYENRIRK